MQSPAFSRGQVSTEKLDELMGHPIGEEETESFLPTSSRPTMAQHFLCQKNGTDLEESEQRDHPEEHGMRPSKKSRIAFGSCNDQDLKNNLWPIIESRDPAAFIWGGDAIYAGTNESCALETELVVVVVTSH